MYNFCVENFTTCDENALFSTGLPNVAPFKALVYCFKPKASRMTYWQGNNTMARIWREKGPSRKLSVEN